MKEKLQPTPQIHKESWDYYKQLYANKLDNFEEMDKFLETYNVPRLNQEEIENLNELITSDEIWIKNLTIPNKQNPCPEASQVNFAKHSKKINTCPSQIIPKNWRVKNNSRLILQGQHYPNTKASQGHYKKENYRPISLVNIGRKSSTKC